MNPQVKPKKNKIKKMSSSEMSSRQTYSLVKKAYNKAGRNPITTASTIRLIQPIATGKTFYTFPILQGDTAQTYPEASLLNRADAFTATHVGLFIGGLTPAGLAATGTNYSLYPYNSRAVQAAQGNGNVLFNNSYLNIAINNVQYLQNFDTRRFNSSPIVQDDIVTSTSVAGATDAQDSLFGDAGFVALIPTLQFSGSAKVDLTLNLPESLAAAVGTIQLIFRGFLSLGASNLNK
jgi:hypothetical protein